MPIYTSLKCESCLQDKLVFHHIPKTAGTTVSGILAGIAESTNRKHLFMPRKLLSEEGHNHLDELFLKKMMNADFIYGHSSFHFWNEHLRKTHKIFTVLREPTSRAISHYYWRNRNQNPKSLTISDFNNNYLQNPDFTNPVCKGIISRKLAYTSKLDNLSNQNLYERALEILLRDFAFIGLLEDIDNWAGRLIGSMGGPSIHIKKIKKDDNPAKKDMLELHKNDLKELNFADYSLYAEILKNKSKFLKYLPKTTSGSNSSIASVTCPEGKVFIVNQQI